MHIHKIKCVDDLRLDLPIKRGLYAITGMNGSGKSTIAARRSGIKYLKAWRVGKGCFGIKHLWDI